MSALLLIPVISILIMGLLIYRAPVLQEEIND